MLRRLFVVMVLAVAGSACSSAPAAPVAAPPTTLPTAISVAPTLPATAVPPPSAIPPTAVPTAIPVAPTTPAAPTPTTQEIAARVDTLMNKLTKQGITSGSILIARDGIVLMKKGYGLADRDKQIPNTPQTQFRITYITNPFTALATLQLQQQGKLKVQDRICTYLANCPAAWDAITIHHLLTQTSGLPDLPESLPATTTAEQLIAQFSSTPL